MALIEPSAPSPTPAQSARARMARFAIRPNRRLGQNFLVDPAIAARIAAMCPVAAEEWVVEIGPGLGALTLPLSRKAGHVLAVEIDRQLIAALSEALAGRDNVTVERADFLRFDLAGWLAARAAQQGGIPAVHVAANIPYYITTPILRKVFAAVPLPASLVFLLQKEAASRLLAAPGSREYGPLGACLAAFYELRARFGVPPHAFIPQPGVDSTVVEARPRPAAADGPPIRPGDLLSLTDALFAHRRKRLLNSLAASPWGHPARVAALPSLLRDLGLGPDVRAEQVKPDQFLALFRALTAIPDDRRASARRASADKP